MICTNCAGDSLDEEDCETCEGHGEICGSCFDPLAFSPCGAHCDDCVEMGDCNCTDENT